MKQRLPLHSNAVWPPVGLVAVFALAYGMLEGGLWIIERSTGTVKGEISSMPEIVKMRSVILGMAAGCYAIFRLWRFHPACNPAYAAWLKSTPWTPSKPLPLGPVFLVWQDAVVIGLLAVFAQWYAHADPAVPPIVFGLTYFIGMTALLAFTRTWRPCLLLGFLWAASILPATRGPLGVGILSAILVVTWYGHRQSLRKFPWPQGGSDEADAAPPDRTKSLLQAQIRIPGLDNAQSMRSPNLGWPFQWLSPKIGNVPISGSTSTAVSALFGWWTFCVIVSSEGEPSPAVVLVFAVMAALIRLSLYCSGVAPSFNVWGRLVSGRVLVPGFDQVFVTPLIVVFLAIAGGVLIRHAGSWHPAATGCVVSLIWFTLLSGPPTMRRWMLTGQHRYRAPSRLRGNKQLLRPT